MRILTFFVLFYIMAITPVFAQIFVDADTERTGFIGLVFKGTQLNDESVVLFGGQGGAVLDDRFGIGFGVYRLLGDIEAPERAQTDLNETIDLDMDYAGLDLRYIFPLHSAIDFSIHTLLGGGRAQYWEGDNSVLAEEGIWIVEPGISLTLDVVALFQVGIAAGYRFVSGVDRLEGLQSGDLNGPSADLIVRLTW